MSEEKDRVRKIFRVLPDGTAISEISGEVVSVSGFRRGQGVGVVRENGEVEVGWKVASFLVVGEARIAVVRQETPTKIREETVPLQNLRALP